MNDERCEPAPLQQKVLQIHDEELRSAAQEEDDDRHPNSKNPYDEIQNALAETWMAFVDQDDRGQRGLRRYQLAGCWHFPGSFGANPQVRRLASCLCLLM